MRDFHEVAASGWYGHPGAVERGRATEILDAVADHVVARAEEAWTALGG